ncbi:unnamed protein product [Aphanomyces euteiches]
MGLLQCVAVLLLLAFGSNADTLANSSAGFCWKNSYGRGAGTMPQSCDGNQDHLGLLCYDKCPTNYTRQALDCHQNCPSDFEDQGLFCRKADYGRGAGYPWKFGDGFNLNKARKRCENITALAIAKRAARSFTPSANLATTPLDAAFAVLPKSIAKRWACKAKSTLAAPSMSRLTNHTLANAPLAFRAKLVCATNRARAATAASAQSVGLAIHRVGSTVALELRRAPNDARK